MAEEERAEDGEHEVTPFELFFDLVFVFAVQVTRLLSEIPNWGVGTLPLPGFAPVAELGQRYAV